jgi:hypothetical protein
MNHDPPTTATDLSQRAQAPTQWGHDLVDHGKSQRSLVETNLGGFLPPRPGCVMSEPSTDALYQRVLECLDNELSLS